MNRIDKIWEKVEKIAIYVILSVFIIAELLSLFFPKISDFMEKKGSLLMIAIVLLAIFRYIDKNISQSNKNEITSVKKFTTDILSILKKSKYREIKVFANSSFKYYHAISESQIKIDTVKLMVRDYADLTQIQFPTDSQARQDFAFNSSQLINNWRLLKEKGQIKNLEIYFYPFDSILHFMIIDNEILHFGLLKPIHGFPGSDLNGSYIVNNNSSNGRDLLNSFNIEFDSIRDNFSKSVDENKTATNKG